LESHGFSLIFMKIQLKSIKNQLIFSKNHESHTMWKFSHSSPRDRPEKIFYWFHRFLINFMGFRGGWIRIKETV
jgi:hypothetical protein